MDLIYKKRYFFIINVPLFVFNFLKDSLVIGYLVTFNNTFILSSFSHLHYRNLYRPLATYYRSPRYNNATPAVIIKPKYINF